jgi:imidazoleglycerol-phosphate dehydratase
MSKSAPGVRFAEVDRETKETRIHVVLDVDGGTKQDISTGIGFFDHMLHAMAFHGQFDVGIEAEGDLHIDDHHTVEDVGIVLGRAFRDALEASGPIERYGSCHMVMDEALILVALDISGRSGLFFDVDFTREQVGGLATENIKEFLRAFTANAGFTVHVKKISGDNDHHIIEGIFKGLGRALEQATRKTERRSGVVSTKGRID